MRTYLTALILGFAAATFGAVAAPSLAPQTTTASAVTVKVTPLSLSGKSWEFEIVFDTHSQELKDDLMKTAVLVAEGGATSAPVEWKGDPAGGHHRKGVLRFNAVTPAPAAVELRIQRPGEPSPRAFRWPLK
ncbi:MAG: hypothetical protein HYU77_15620 [Betaproteobacteria bacterium]|nr:hypothetical protein [Betaproteobacteria bacterium]